MSPYFGCLVFHQARIKEFQQKRTAAEGSRRAKTADKRSAQVSSKREKKKKGVKGKKKGDKAATAAEATTEGNFWTVKNACQFLDSGRGVTRVWK